MADSMLPDRYPQQLRKAFFDDTLAILRKHRNDLLSFEEARRALRVLEERSRLQDLLARTVLATGTVGGVQVLIGGEGTWDELRQSSVLLAQYGVPGLAIGTLGVLGPMRMAYGRTISVMRFLSGLLSDLVAETLAEGD